MTLLDDCRLLAAKISSGSVGELLLPLEAIGATSIAWIVKELRTNISSRLGTNSNEMQGPLG